MNWQFLPSYFETSIHKVFYTFIFIWIILLQYQLYICNYTIKQCGKTTLSYVLNDHICHKLHSESLISLWIIIWLEKHYELFLSIIFHPKEHTISHNTYLVPIKELVACLIITFIQYVSRLFPSLYLNIIIYKSDSRCKMWDMAGDVCINSKIVN